MVVTKEQIRHLGWLCRIELTDHELAKYAGQIEDVIKYLDKLDEAPISEETKPVAASKKFSDLRDDTPVEFSSDPLGTKYRKDGFVKGPRMV